MVRVLILLLGPKQTRDLGPKLILCSSKHDWWPVILNNARQ
jgi:hypothetical protein